MNALSDEDKAKFKQAMVKEAEKLLEAGRPLGIDGLCVCLKKPLAK